MYNRSDRKVLLCLLLLGAMALVVMHVFEGGMATYTDKKDAGPESESETLYASDYVGKRKTYRSDYDEEAARHELFPFDPNTATASDFRRLGLPDWQIRSIMRFRSRGGEYRKPEDFAYTYKLTAKKYKELLPYIKISNDYLPASTLLKDVRVVEESDSDQFGHYVKIGEGEHIDLNVGDTAELRKVPGIGVYFSGEIYRYGRRLGGYYDIDQLDSITNFPQPTKKYFKIDRSKIRKMNVNTATFLQLRAHPYMGYYRARTIVEYRRKKGRITDINQLSTSPHFTSDDIARLLPYIEY